MPRVRKRKKIYDVRVWPTWLLVGAGWLIARLPLPLINGIAHVSGRLFYRFGRGRREVTLTNLRLCFPELDDVERERLARASFLHTAWGALETMMVWLNPGRGIASRTRIDGTENLERARREGRGVILLGGHFSAIDVLGPGMQPLDIDVIYRENRNPVWEWLQVRGRRHYFDGVIERSDVRGILTRLRAGRTIWYAADQDYGRKRSVFAPFFGIPTASIRATGQLARFNGSPVLLISTHRNLSTYSWSASMSSPLTGYPTGNDVADATIINQVIEAAIREQPEQYLWMHRRFKTRPVGETSPYGTDAPR